MKAVSTRMLGMSGAFSTAKPACSTRLVQRAHAADAVQHLAADLEESLICAVVLMSSMARSTWASRTATVLTPPTTSAAFSLLASQRAAALVAPRGRQRTPTRPRACGVKKASAWIDTNRSACTRRALRTRSCSGTK
jgi:hypothetical protein